MDKEDIKKFLTEAYHMYSYEVEGKPETYYQYIAGWIDAIDYVSQLLEVDIE